MKPEYPLTIKSEGEPDELVHSEEELVMTLEWFDSDSGDESVQVADARGRAVRLKVDAMVVKTFELANP